jgi:hypothetical protein
MTIDYTPGIKKIFDEVSGTANAVDRLTEAVKAHTAELARQFDLSKPLRDATASQLEATAKMITAQTEML